MNEIEKYLFAKERIAFLIDAHRGSTVYYPFFGYEAWGLSRQAFLQIFTELGLSDYEMRFDDYGVTVYINF